MSFSLTSSLRRFKPERQAFHLGRRSDAALPFLSEDVTSGPELLLDTCVYIDVLQDRAPDALQSLLATRLCNHSGIALAELTHLFGRLDPRDPRTKPVWAQVSGVIAAMTSHRLAAPSLNAQGEAGILVGLVVRLAGIEVGKEQALLNDAMLYLQAIEQGHILLTRNIREFDWFDQLFPRRRVLFYHRVD